MKKMNLDSNFEVDAWAKKFPLVLKKTGLINPVIMDVGANIGSTLLALSTLGYKNNILVDPCWNLSYFKKEIKAKGISLADYSQRGIEILPICGLKSEVPYHIPDLIIKTYNPWVTWDHILSKASANWFISDDSWIDLDLYPDLELVYAFNIFKTPKEFAYLDPQGPNHKRLQLFHRK